MTGWLDADPDSGRLAYAPHTDSSHRFPEWQPLYRFLSGAATRWRARGS